MLLPELRKAPDDTSHTNHGILSGRPPPFAMQLILRRSVSLMAPKHSLFEQKNSLFRRVGNFAIIPAAMTFNSTVLRKRSLS